LFEKDELDNKSIRFPEEYFQEIFEFFNQYNFTIDENDPNDAEVSVDPEMLGHIFENLLEDNKDKGAFYTPKEIVHYMCQESLIEYLCTSLNFDKDEQKDLITQLVKTKEIDKNLKDSLIEVEKALDKVKICDPAIGSGAFPMGLLQEIFSIKQSIYYNIHNTLDNFPAGKEKLKIIQNNIYGVDIEQGAVDIARLRFWLSLVVEEAEAKPLPNLDYKIMCGNSLISRYPLDIPLKNVFDQYNKVKKPDEKLSLKKYKDLVNSYTDTHIGKDVFKSMIEEIKATFKTSLSSKEINYRVKKAKIVNEYEEVGIFGTRKADHDKAGYKKAKLELQKLLKAEEDVKNNKIYENSFEWRFEFPDLLDEEGNFQGFNIVIGNPPYGASFSKTETKFFNNKYIYKDNETESYILFIEKSASLQSILGSVWFIIPSNISTNHNYSNIRKFILSNFSLHIIVDLGANIFKNAKVDSCIIAFKNKQINNNNFYSGKISEIDISKIELKLSKQDYFLATPQNIFNFYISADTSNLTQKINSKTTLRLSDFINFSRGIEYGYNSNFVSSDKKNKKPLVAGRCFYRYTLKFENKYIDFDYNDTSNFKNNCIYETTKIFVRRIGKEIIAYLDDEKYYNVCDVYNLLPKSNDVDLYELLGLLNSKCINYYFKNFFKNAKVLFPKIPIKYLKQIPIILSNGNISKLAKKIQEDKKNNIDTFVLEKEIDCIVYKLYDLTYDEVLVIDPLTPITREEYEIEID
ncbi:MAG: TaqI-like C-terminal specificity domain-containing protein, partial [Bacteroidales bacterium]|nr:TaqI-like C-terminal specificity domain-containing protein [Bacteroidales bacterium]